MTDDMREKARELAVKHGPSRETEAYHMYVRVLTKVRNAALEEAAAKLEEMAAGLERHEMTMRANGHKSKAAGPYRRCMVSTARDIRALKDKE